MGLKKLDKCLLDSFLILKVLDFYGNKLKQLDWSFIKIFINLVYIDIFGNIFMEFFNLLIMILLYIKSIYLNDNDWKCICVLEWVKVFFSFILEFVMCSILEFF